MKKIKLAKLVKEEIRSILSESTLEVGTTITIPRDLTTDPINKQGQQGIVKFMEEGTVYILFQDGLVGGYQEEVFGLEEASVEDVENQKELNKELEKTSDISKEMSDLSEYQNPELEGIIIKLVKKIAKRYGYSENDAFLAIKFTLDNVKDDFGEDTKEPIKEEEYDMDLETEPTKKSLKQPDSVIKMAQELENIQKDMKSLVKQWKVAQGDEKADLLNQLKAKTRQKNELEELI